MKSDLTYSRDVLYEVITLHSRQRLKWRGSTKLGVREDEFVLSTVERVYSAETARGGGGGGHTTQKKNLTTSPKRWRSMAMNEQQNSVCSE